jgi:hypothetical protein
MAYVRKNKNLELELQTKHEVLPNAIYSLPEIAILVNLHINTVRAMIKAAGIKPNAGRFYKMLGSDVIKLFVKPE